MQNANKEKPLAQVGEKYLYPSEIKGLIKPGLSKEDSTIMLTSLIEKWVRKQLILQKAELNLTDNEKDVNKALDEYRTSLIIFKYEQKFIQEKLDTSVSNSEIEKYYDQNTSNFILNFDIVKAQYIKLPLKAPNIDKLKDLMRTESEENVKALESYCFQNARKYDYFNDDWVDLDNIRSVFPVEIPGNETYLKSTKFIEAKDSLYYYIVNVKDAKTKGNIAPLNFVVNDIKSIIILKRKQKLINDIENHIYFDAMNTNKFTIFNN
jgi:hypothetical protein